MNDKITIKVVGIGGFGLKSIKNLKESGIKDVEFIGINHDLDLLELTDAEYKIQIEKNLVNNDITLESKEKIKSALEGTDMVFIISGMGGKTGSNVSSIVASLAKDVGALTVGIVTKPFTFEGKEKVNNASFGIDELKKYIDTLFVIPNENLKNMINKNIRMNDAYQEVDFIIEECIKTLTNIINQKETKDVDFNDIKQLMNKRGNALIGIGIKNKKNSILDAVKNAVLNPLMEKSMIGATSVIVNIRCDESFTLIEAEDAMEEVRKLINNKDLTAIFSLTIDKTLDVEAIITVIAFE